MRSLRAAAVAALLVFAFSCAVRQDLGRLPGSGDAADAASTPAPAFPSATARAGWRWVSPFPTGDDLRGIFAAPSGDLWLLGSNGTVLRRSADGSIREMLDPDVETRYYAGWATSDDDVWIIGERRGGTDVRRWDGRRWTDTYSLRDYPVHAGVGAGRDVAWATASIFAVVWNGAEWLMAPADTTDPLRGVWASGPSDAWAVGDRGRLLHWENGAFRDTRPVGGAPVYATDRNYVAVWGSSSSDVWAGYEQPTRNQVGFVHFDGSSWSDLPPLAAACRTRPETPRPSVRGARMAGTSRARIVAVLGQGCTFGYDGLRWTQLTSTDPLAVEVAVTSVAAAGGDIFAVGDQGALLRLDEGAAPPWVPLFPALREDLSQVALLGEEPWALAQSHIVRLADGRWVDVAGTEGATAFAFGASSDLWFARGAGESEIVLRREGRDEVTARVPHTNALAVQGGTVWLSGPRGFVARGDGRRFETVATDVDESLRSIGLVDPETAIVSGTRSLGAERYVRTVLRVSHGRAEVALADESGSDAAPVFVGRDAAIWVGGLPLVRWTGGSVGRVLLGDDAPVEGIAPAAGASLWFAGGGLIRAWDGSSAQRVFGTGRRLSALASVDDVSWAVGERGATLVYLPRGTPPR